MDRPDRDRRHSPSRKGRRSRMAVGGREPAHTGRAWMAAYLCAADAHV